MLSADECADDHCHSAILKIIIFYNMNKIWKYGIKINYYNMNILQNVGTHYKKLKILPMICRDIIICIYFFAIFKLISFQTLIV